jgi:hypothetical protein
METILNTGFENDPNPELLVIANTIRDKLSIPPASVTYAAVTPNVVTLTLRISAFEEAMSRGNDPDDVEARDLARAELIDTLELMALSLESITPGDRASLATTGYRLRKIRERDTTPTGTPQNVSAKPTGNQGEARVTCTAVQQATAYEARATKDIAAGPFVSCPPATGVRGLLFTGLERGKDWFFQIRAIGPNGVGPWSDPAMMMVV